MECGREGSLRVGLYLSTLPTEDRRGMAAAREQRVRRRRPALPRTHTNKPLTDTPHVTGIKRFRACYVAFLGVASVFEAKASLLGVYCIPIVNVCQRYFSSWY